MDSSEKRGFGLNLISDLDPNPDSGIGNGMVRVVVVVVAGHGAGSGRVWSQSKEIAREAVQWSTRSESLVSETWASDWPCPQREPSVVSPSAWVPFRVVVGELLLLAHHSASYALT